MGETRRHGCFPVIQLVAVWTVVIVVEAGSTGSSKSRGEIIVAWTRAGALEVGGNGGGHGAFWMWVTGQE